MLFRLNCHAILTNRYHLSKMIAENSSFALTNVIPSDIVKPEQKSKRTGKEVRVAPYSDEEPGESDSENRNKKRKR